MVFEAVCKRLIERRPTLEGLIEIKERSLEGHSSKINVLNYLLITKLRDPKSPAVFVCKRYRCLWYSAYCSSKDEMILAM